MPRLRTILTLALFLGAGCETSSAAREDGGVPDGGVTDGGTPDSGVPDGGTTAPDAGPDAGMTDAGPCLANGNIGQCITEASCAALPDYSSTAGACTAADLECCSPTPDLANNPPVPSGWQLLPQSSQTPAMTTWAEELLADPTDYPMFSSAMMTFGGVTVLAVLEWLPPNLQNSAVHRGVVLFQPS